MRVAPTVRWTVSVLPFLRARNLPVKGRSTPFVALYMPQALQRMRLGSSLSRRQRQVASQEQLAHREGCPSRRLLLLRERAEAALLPGGLAAAACRHSGRGS